MKLPPRDRGIVLILSTFLLGSVGRASNDYQRSRLQPPAPPPPKWGRIVDIGSIYSKGEIV